MSSSEIAVSVRGLSKSYTIAHNTAKHTTAAEALVSKLRNPFQKSEKETFWALKDVEFDIKKGDVVGVIGRNGAGKSTLLKILSRITEPTTGRIALYGRVGSLLEVGTGFHPELTGRENIYLNGAILGMSKREITRQFDAIVDFSGTEQFLDTPVKRYSSGMYVRLAFAVAAHLNPEILVVDEVLAVGDAEFQKKCLGKMKDVSESGRTILFVSHNMTAVSTLCNKAIMLSKGMVEIYGNTSEATAHYYTATLTAKGRCVDLVNVTRSGSGTAKFASISVIPVDGKGEEIPIVFTGCDLNIEVSIQGLATTAASNVAVIIYDATGYRLVDVNTALDGKFLSMQARERATVKFVLYNVLLKPGTYYIGLWLGRAGIEDIDDIEFATTLTLEEKGNGHTEVFPGPYQCRFKSQIVANDGMGA